MNFYFKPVADQLPNRELRVAPDMLPIGSIRLAQVWIDDQPFGPTVAALDETVDALRTSCA